MATANYVFGEQGLLQKWLRTIAQLTRVADFDEKKVGYLYNERHVQAVNPRRTMEPAARFPARNNLL